jgi:hypothetical protein
MAAFIKQAIKKHLKEQGIDWRKEPEKKSKRQLTKKLFSYLLTLTILVIPFQSN